MLQARKWIFPVFLFLYHLFFSVMAYRYVLANNGDAMRYWFVGEDLSAKSWLDFLNPGTDVVKMITFPLVHYLKMPLWSGFVLFSILSFLGLIFLYRLLLKMAGESKKLEFIAMLLLLLPNLHFWTGLVGKEALLFPALVGFLIAMQKNKNHKLLFFVSLLFVSMIRPHIGFILLLSYVLSLLITEKLSLRRKMIIGGIFVMSTSFLLVVLTRLQDFSGGIPRVIRKYEAHIQHFKKTDGYVPLDNYPLPIKIFTFYFRPLPLEKQGLFYQIISIENLVLLVSFMTILFYLIKFFKSLRQNHLFIFCALFLLLMAIMYVYGYANYGIIMRTKMMAAPFFYVLMIEALRKKRLQSFLE